MSTQTYNKISDAMTKVNDTLRSVFYRDGTRCFLLRRSGETSAFTAVIELVDGYFVDWNEYREQSSLSIADRNTSGLSDKIAQASHFAFGVPVGSKIDVFKISSDARDRIKPDGLDPFWKLYGVREINLRYTVV